MQPSDIEDAAMFLLHLRTQRDQVGGLPGELAPKSLDDAYAIQDATHRFAGWPIGLVKVGCTSEIAQQVLGIPHPIGGRVPTDAVFASGAEVPMEFFAAPPLLECEIAVQVDGDGNVTAVAPAIELVNARFKDTSKVRGEHIIADNSAGCGAVLGTPVSLADVGDLNDLAMTLRAGETQIAAGSAAALLGGPMASLEWALAHEASRDRAVGAGAWIITGTCTGLTPTEPGTSYTADFGTLGSVGFTLTV